MALPIPVSASRSQPFQVLGTLQLGRWVTRAPNWILVAAVVWLVVVMVWVVGGDRLAVQSALLMDVRLGPPDLGHLFGTDNFGRDILARVIVGARVSFTVGVLVALSSTALGTLAGLTASTYPRLDRVLMRILDGFMAFPAAILAIAMIAALGTGIWQESLALTVVFFPRTARIMRGVGLQLRGRQFVEAAVVVGGTPTHIVLRHILPNTLGPLIIQGSYILGRAIVTDAGLSFLGLGAPPPTPSWGNMLGDARTFMQDAWWFVAFPGLAIVLTVLSVNLLGDAMRDRLDPKLR
jgi:peptide/nickel transport system permease protein